MGASESPNPFCEIKGRWEGYGRVHLYNGANLSADSQSQLCKEIGREVMASVQSITALRAAVDRVSAAAGLSAEWLESGHEDPLRQTAAFTLWPSGGRTGGP